MVSDPKLDRSPTLEALLWGGPMYAFRTRAAMAGAVASCLALGACGSSGSDDSSSKAAGSPSKTLTVYSSMPLQGDSMPFAQSVVDGAKMAVQAAGGKAGAYTIKYVSL